MRVIFLPVDDRSECGSATAMVYTFKQPGLYMYLNHNLIEAILLGAAAHVKVKGD